MSVLMKLSLWFVSMILLFTLAPMGNLPVSAQESPQGQLPLTGSLDAHDPTLFKDGDTYYVARTNSTQLRSASSLNGPWTNVVGVLPGQIFWAPHVREVDGMFYMYYAVSSFGTNDSRIGVKFTSTPGIPASWVDYPYVIASGAYDPNGATHNAIDPAIHQNDEGKWWIVWGSHFDGIMIQRLNDDLISVTGPITLLAHRGSERFPVTNPNFNRVEGPVIFKRGAFYYLLVAWDWCCRANGNDNTYKIVVGRSEQIDGPYVDKNGISLAQGGGSIILNSRVALPGIITGSQLFRAPGGPDIFIEDGTYYLIYHAYRPGTTMAIRTIDWHDDWPVFYESDGGPYDLRDQYFYRLVNQDGIISDPNSLQNPVASNRCLTVTDDNGELDVIQAECSDSAQQVWQLDRKFDGFYRLKNIVAGGQRTCLTVADDAGDDPPNVRVAPCLDEDEPLQQWYFDDTGHGFHRPVVKEANLALEVENVDGIIGMNVEGRYRRDGDHQAGNLTQAAKWPPQQWRFSMVDDTTPPSLSVTATPNRLAPNHKMVTVNMGLEVTDNLDPQPAVTLLSVVSNEPDTGQGDDTANDIVIVDNRTILLRAERANNSAGRIYTISYAATDAYGNSTMAEAKVTVSPAHSNEYGVEASATLDRDQLDFHSYVPFIQP